MRDEVKVTLDFVGEENLLLIVLRVLHYHITPGSVDQLALRYYRAERIGAIYSNEFYRINQCKRNSGCLAHLYYRNSHP